MRLMLNIMVSLTLILLTCTSHSNQIKCLNQSEQAEIAYQLKDFTLLKRIHEDTNFVLNECMRRKACDDISFYQQKRFIIPAMVVALAAGFAIGNKWP